jgi:hypothetical protein
LAFIGCSSLLGDFEVRSGPAGGVEAGPGDGGPNPDSSGDSSASDAPTDSPIVNCTAPKVTCGSVCVDLDSDSKHCGVCDRGCFGGICSTRVCKQALLAARTDVQVATLAATDTDLFFATDINDVVQRPIAVGGALAKLGTAQGQVYAIAIAGSRVFFTAALGLKWDTWTAIAGMPGSAAPRAQTLSGTPVGLIAAGGNIHTLHVTSAIPEAFQVISCPQGAGACVGNFDGAGRPSKNLAAGNGLIYWTDQLGSIYTMPEGIGARTLIAMNEATPDSPAWDGMALFWVNGGSLKVRRIPYPNPPVVDFRDVSPSSPNDMTVDATYLYYAQNDGAGDVLFAVKKSAPASTPPLRLASGEIRRFVQNAKGLFWANSTGIHAVAKP